MSQVPSTSSLDTKLKAGSESRDDSSSVSSFSDLLGAFHTVTNFLQPYTGILLGILLLSFSLSPFRFWPGPGLPADQWHYGSWFFNGTIGVILVFLIVLALITIFAPTRVFAGPLRFAHLEYSPKLPALISAIPAWALSHIVFVPFLPLSPLLIIFVLLLAWHFVAYQYRRRLAAIMTTATEIRTRIDHAQARASKAAELAYKYTDQALTTASATRRTASLTLTLHSTDFFDVANDAWTAIARDAIPIRQIYKAAKDVKDRAQQVLVEEPPDEDFGEDDDDDDDDDDDNEGHGGDGGIGAGGGKQRVEMLVDMLVEKVDDTVAAAKHAEDLVRKAQNAVESSKTAKELAADTRKKVKEEAERVEKLGITIAQNVAKVDKDVWDVEVLASTARRLLEKAVETAVEGEMVPAESSIKEALGVVDGAVQKPGLVKQVDNLCGLVANTRKDWVDLMVTTPKDTGLAILPYPPLSRVPIASQAR